MTDLGDSEEWAIMCTLAPFTDSESTGRAVCVENNGFELKLSKGDAQKATEHGHTSVPDCYETRRICTQCILT